MFDFNLESILLNIPAILIGFTFHEFAHAFVSHRLGDPTPASQGRLSLYPHVHIDIIGFLLILFVGFGWAKPVEVNPRYYKNPRVGDILVSIAGPLANLVLAFIFTIVYVLVYNSYSIENRILDQLLNIIDQTIWINIILFLFNLIPLPPLDGFHVLSGFVSSKNYRMISFLEQYSKIILILILVTPVVSNVIVPPAEFIYDAFYGIFGFY